MSQTKLAIVCTHPVQYYSPVFRQLARSAAVQPRVFYTWSQSAQGALYDPDFQVNFAWDIPLLDGYESEFVENVARQPTSARFFGIRTPKLNDAVSGWGAQAVLVYGWNNSAHLGVMRHFHRRVPVLFRGDSTLLDPSPPMRSWARRRWLSWVYSHVDKAIAVGKNNHDYYRWCGIPDSRIACAPHSVDNQRFADSGQQVNADVLRRQLNIDADAVVAIFAAKFSVKKDPMLLLDAFMATQLKSHLVFVGSGELENRMRARAGGDPRIHFLPFQNQSGMPAIYRLGDVFVLPSRGPGETWGLAMNEAMASGRLVIASSRAGGTRDLIQEDLSGWQFEAGDGNALRNALSRAVAIGRDELLRKGSRAQAWIQAWSTERAAAGIEAAAVESVVRVSRGQSRVLA